MRAAVASFTSLTIMQLTYSNGTTVGTASSSGEDFVPFHKSLVARENIDRRRLE